MTFLSRIAAGNGLLGKRTADLLTLLGMDGRVKGDIPTLCADRKEWAAALVWMDSNAPILLADVQGLPVEERNLLARVLGVPAGQRSAAQTASLIMAQLAAVEVEVAAPLSFLEWLAVTDSNAHGQVKAWPKARLDKELRAAPVVFPQVPTTFADLRERYAFCVWVSQGGSPGDFSSMAPELQDKAYTLLQVRGAPADTMAVVASALSGKKMSLTEKAAAAPGGAGPALVPGGVPLSALPLNRVVDMGASGGRAEDPMDVDAQGGSARRKGGQLTAWDGPFHYNPDCVTGSIMRADLEALRFKYGSLKLSMFAFLSAAEVATYRQALKLEASGLDHDSFSKQYSVWPWGQSLAVEQTQKFKAERLGRALMNALRCDNENFSSWSEQQTRGFHEKERERISSVFEEAIESGNLSDLLLAHNELKDHAQRVLKAECEVADRLYATHTYEEFREMQTGRHRQLDSLVTFFDMSGRRVKTESNKRPTGEQEQYMAGFYISFYRSWRASDCSTEDADEMLSMGRMFASHSMTSGSGPRGGRSSPPASSGSGGGGGKTTPSVGAKGKGAPSDGSGVAGQRHIYKSCKVGHTLPSSAVVIGPALGLEGPTFACNCCGEKGHWKGECPRFWGEQDKPLPGWRKDGRKDRAAWEGDNPTKATFKAWLQFVKENFPKGGHPAAMDGAPDMNDYQHRAKKGAGP